MPLYRQYLKKYSYLVEVLAVPLWLYPSSSYGELPLRDTSLAARHPGWCVKRWVWVWLLDVKGGIEDWGRWEVVGRLGDGQCFGDLGRCVRIWYGLIEWEAIDVCLELVHTCLSGTQHVSLISSTQCLETGDNRMETPWKRCSLANKGVFCSQSLVPPMLDIQKQKRMGWSIWFLFFYALY